MLLFNSSAKLKLQEAGLRLKLMFDRLTEYGNENYELRERLKRRNQRIADLEKSNAELQLLVKGMGYTVEVVPQKVEPSHLALKKDRQH